MCVMCNRCVYSLIQRVLLADTMMQSMQSYDSKNKQVRYGCCLSELISYKNNKRNNTHNVCRAQPVVSFWNLKEDCGKYLQQPSSLSFEWSNTHTQFAQILHHHMQRSHRECCVWKDACAQLDCSKSQFARKLSPHSMCDFALEGPIKGQKRIPVSSPWEVSWLQHRTIDCVVHLSGLVQPK